jgi:hypothetical protein
MWPNRGLPAAGRTVPLVATRICQMSFFTGFGVSSLMYYGLSVAFTSPGSFQHFKEVDLSEDELPLLPSGKHEEGVSAVPDKEPGGGHCFHED